MSDWADEKASRLDTCTSECYCQHVSDGPCSMCRIAAALREARADGEAKTKAVLHDLLAACWGAIDPEQFPELSKECSEALSCDGDGPCKWYGEALDQASAEGLERGRQEERWACHATVEDTLSDCHDQGEKGLVGLRWAKQRISERGPMRKPEEE